ncbi:MAG TPA: hypothetical protein ENJ08_06835 [Gammaproteobacteria bacterium]|nr:hypothetical protein [Gammaproteobacteria bacterium]
MTSCNIDIEQYLGEEITNICSNDYHNKDFNHCAHFVSHILGFRFGYKCRNQTGKGEASDSANIRVQEVFSKCPGVGKWVDKPSSLRFCLAFITAAGNVDLKNKKMLNVGKKHIGIFHKGMIYHYSNGKDKVVKQTASAFSRHYSGNGITVYYGLMPLKS